MSSSGCFLYWTLQEPSPFMHIEDMPGSELAERHKVLGKEDPGLVFLY